MQEENNKYIFCTKCGTRLSREFSFCYNCGAKVQRDIIVETKVESTPETKLESTPETKAEIPSLELFEEHPVVKNKKPRGFILNIIKKSLILAIAILMIVAVFLPVVRYETEYLDEYDVSMKFTAIDGIHLLVNSFGSLDEEDMRDEIEEISDEIEEYTRDWTNGEELEKLSSYIKKLFKLYLRSENISTPWELVFIGVFSLAQIILALLLLAFAALSFAALFTNKIKDFSKASFIILGINAALLAANGFAYYLSFGGKYTPAKLTAIQICVLIFAFFIFLAFTLIRFLVNKNKASVGEIVKRSLGAVFAVVLLFSCFAPVVSTEVKTKFANSNQEKRLTSKIDTSLFTEFWLDEQTKEQLDDSDEKSIDAQIMSNYSRLEDYTKKEFEKGDDDGLNKSIFAALLLNYGAYDYCGFFSFGTAAVILVFMCSVALIWKNLYELATGKRLSSGISISAKAIAIIMSALILALIIVSCVMVNYNVKPIDIIYKARIAYGPILMMISAVAMTCVPDALRKTYQKQQPDEEIVRFNEIDNTNTLVL